MSAEWKPDGDEKPTIGDIVKELTVERFGYTRPQYGVKRDTDGRILRGPSLPCGCPLDADCDGNHPGAQL